MGHYMHRYINVQLAIIVTYHLRLDVLKIQLAEHKSPGAMVISQAQRPIGDLLILSVCFEFISITRLADFGSPLAEIRSL